MSDDKRELAAAQDDGYSADRRTRPGAVVTPRS